MGKFYWLKLPRGFFHRHDIRALRSRADGEVYEDLFIRLMAEAIDHDGTLRFSDELPFDIETLAAAIETTPEKLEPALKLYKKLNMVVEMKDGTLYLPNVPQMIGSAANNDNANRQREYRKKQTSVTEALQNITGCVTKCNGTVTDSVTNSNESKSKSKRIESELDIKKERVEKKADKTSARSRFIPPTLEEVSAYCDERKNGIDPQAFVDFYSSKNWCVGKNKMADWRACMRTWEARRKAEPVRSSKADNTPIMENEYSKEHLKQKERESLDLLDELLAEGDV